jgi:hypothetical protein
VCPDVDEAIVLARDKYMLMDGQEGTVPLAFDPDTGVVLAECAIPPQDRAALAQGLRWGGVG